MENAAKLISALGNLIGAIAWPGVLVFLAMYFRKEIAQACAGLPQFMGRLRKMKIAGMEAELEALADKASDKGEIPLNRLAPPQDLPLKRERVGVNTFFANSISSVCSLTLYA